MEAEKQMSRCPRGLLEASTLSLDVYDSYSYSYGYPDVEEKKSEKKAGQRASVLTNKLNFTAIHPFCHTYQNAKSFLMKRRFKTPKTFCRR